MLVAVVPLATSTVAIAGISAGAAIIGGVLGALAGGLSTYLLDRRRERARARAGARLLRSDLRIIAGQFRTAAKHQRWFLFSRLRIEAWEEYRDVLAATMGTDSWELVATAVSRVRQVESNITTALAQTPQLVKALAPQAHPIGNDAAENLKIIVDDLRRAYDALSPLADGPIADDNFALPIAEQS